MCKDDPTAQTPLKRRRITRACDRCHRGGIRCSGSANPAVCSPCADFGSECTYNRPMKRRGPPAKSREGIAPSTAPLARWSLPDPSEGWKYREIATHEQIEALVDAYYAIVYPIYPIFHWPTFTANVRRRVYMTYPAFHAALMSVCALASARLRDGAPTSPHARAPTRNPLDAPAPTSEVFYQAAITSYPRDLTKATDFDYKRAKPLLATLAIQYGEIPAVHAHVGDYMTLCAIDGFHNESRWHNDLNEIEVQERRRLFWLAYQLDVYAATTWGGIIRHRESQSTVLYPTEVYSDNDITATTIHPSLPPSSPVSFLHGWNFTVDLYRILEHAVSRLRTRNHSFDQGNQIAALFSEGRVGSGSNELSPDDLLGVVEGLYHALPPELRRTSEMTGEVEKDRYGFQAANILVTMQTVKMVVAGMAEWSVEQRCAIAGELLDAFATVPRAYIQAIGTPLLHHLAGVGHLLAGIIHSPLSPGAYLHVRTVLLSMADLLSSLEVHLNTATAGIAPKLREHVGRIDLYMRNATEGGRTGLGPFNTGVPAAPFRHPHAATVTIKNEPNTAPTPFPLYLPNTSPSSAASLIAPLIPSSLTPPRTQPIPLMPPLPRSNSHPQSGTPFPTVSSQSLLSFGQAASFGLEANGGVIPCPVPGPGPLQPRLAQQQQRGFHPSPQPQQQQAQPKTPMDQQAYQLPDDLFVDWPFLFNEFGFQGDAFDFLSAGAGQELGQGLASGSGVGLGQGQASGSGLGPGLGQALESGSGVALGHEAGISRLR